MCGVDRSCALDHECRCARSTSWGCLRRLDAMGTSATRGRAAPTRGVKAVLHHLVPALRARYPEVTIIVRGDGAFGVPKVINTCRHLKVRFCLGKPQNAALTRLLALSAATESHPFADCTALVRRCGPLPWPKRAASP